MSKAQKKPAVRAKAKSKAKPRSAPKSKKAAKVAPARKKAAPAKTTKPSVKAVARSSPPGPPQPDVTAPPPPVRVAPPRRRVSIGEALAQLNAATLEGVTAELTPFGLATEVELTPNPGLAALLGPEPRPLSVLVGALEDWASARRASGAAVQFGRRAHDDALAQAEPLAGSEAVPATTDEGANLILVAEVTQLLEETPRSREALEGFVKRNCRL